LPDAVGAARPTLHHVRLIHAGGKRDRRPTPDQIEKIFAWFAERVQCVQEFSEFSVLRRTAHVDQARKGCCA